MTSALRRSICGVLIATALVAFGGPAQARWLKVQTAHFNVHADTSEATARRYAEDLEVFDRLLRLIHGVAEVDPLGRRLDIYLLDPGDMRRLYSGPNRANVAGFYLASPWSIFAAALRGEDGDPWVRHEYVHHFLAQYSSSAYPHWLNEGYAEYFSTARIDGGKVEVGRSAEARIYSLAVAPWPAMGDLLGKPISKISAVERPSFYAVAWLLTHYFLSDATTSQTRYKQLKAYTKLVGEGGDPVASMREATGLDTVGLERALRAYHNQKLSGYALEFRGPQAPATVEVLSPAADALLVDRLRLNETLSEAAGKPLLEKIRKEAAGFPGDRLAELALADAEISVGDAQAGERILERRLAAQPADVDALELAGLARMQQMSRLKGEAAVTEAREAQPYFARAYRADPNRFASLFGFVRTRRLLDQPYPQDATLDAVLAAFRLAPQVDEIRFEAARLLALRGRKADATALLRPMGNHPHGGAAAEAAQKLIDEIERSPG